MVSVSFVWGRFRPFSDPAPEATDKPAGTPKAVKGYCHILMVVYTSITKTPNLALACSHRPLALCRGSTPDETGRKVADSGRPECLL